MALKGITVLELAGLAPAPFCGMLLRDFGASVTVIDKKSNPIRILHEGKQRISIDLRNPKGPELLQKLSKCADVLIEPYRPGVMERLNLGPEHLMSDNSRLIYARLSGFGQSGPLSQKSGHDNNYLGLSGILSMLGRANEKPTPPVNLLADFAGGGLLCAFGIVCALMERNVSGRGQIVDAGMTEGAAYVGSWLMRSQQLKMLAWDNGRGRSLLDSGRFFYDTYETKDGKFMTVGAIEPKFYENFLKGLGLKGIEQNGDNKSNAELVTRIFKTKTQKEWTKVFESLDACVFPVLDFKCADEHPQSIYRKSFLKKCKTNGMVVPKPSPRLSRTPAISGFEDDRIHNGIEDMFNEIGLDKDAVEKLKNEGVLE